MTKAEARSAVEAEIGKFGEGIARLSPSEVQAIYAAEVAKYGPGRDAFQGTRTQVSAALQLKNPPPHALPSAAASIHVSRGTRDAQHDECRSQVTDAHALLSERARALDPNHTDAHHFVQKLHGSALWREVDRCMAEAGITSSAGGVS